jgi:hypothetical protein
MISLLSGTFQKERRKIYGERYDDERRTDGGTIRVNQHQRRMAAETRAGGSCLIYRQG